MLRKTISQHSKKKKINCKTGAMEQVPILACFHYPYVDIAFSSFPYYLIGSCYTFDLRKRYFQPTKTEKNRINLSVLQELVLLQRYSRAQGMKAQIIWIRVFPLMLFTLIALVHATLLSVLQCAPAHVASEPVQTKMSVAITNAWGAARHLTTTPLAWPAAITTMKESACPPALPTPTSLRAGAV